MVLLEEPKKKKNKHYYQGFFVPKNKTKYRGDLSKIVYRSGWEKKVMIYFDTNPNVIEWASEEIIIPYISPIDKKIHRYFPDFLIKIRLANGTIKNMVLEIKPAAQTKTPIKRRRKTKKFINEVYTWGINSAKWEAAAQWCKERGCEFKILTETDLGL